MAKTNDYRRFMAKEELHKSLNSLVGILNGEAADQKVTFSEQQEVTNWYSLHKHLLNVHPFTEIFPILDLAFEDDMLSDEEVQDLLWLCEQYLDHRKDELYFDPITSNIQVLEGILHGILADGVLADKELEALNEWLNDHDGLSGIYPFDEVYGLLLAAKEDGKISQSEKEMLKAYFSTFVDTRDSFNIHAPDVKCLQEKYCIGGICAVCPEIQFEGKTFCITGASNRATKSDFANIITSHGGIYNDGVTKKTDYLIVGAEGNPCWAYSCYGRKVEKAMKIRRDGGKVIIVHENDFWDLV